MIKLTNVTLLDKKNDRAPINFSNESNVTYISYADRCIFNLLSIRQQYIKDGEMMIDDFSLFPLKDQKKYAFVLNINSAVISLNAVFVLELSFKDKTRGLLKKELQTLKDLPLTNHDEELIKINKILEVCHKFDAKYILINLNDEINNAHEPLIKEAIDFHEELTYFVLERKADLGVARIANPKSIAVIDDKDSKTSDELTSPGEKILQDQYRDKKDESIMTVTSTMPILTDEIIKRQFEEDFEKEFEEFNIDIAYKKATEKKEVEMALGRKKPKNMKEAKPSRNLIFVKEIFKHLYLYYLFIGLFSIFLSVCSFTCTYLISHDNGLIAGILIFLDIIFIFMHLYIIGSTYAGIKSKLVDKSYKIAFAGFYILFTFIGLLLGLGFIVILSVNDVFVKIHEYAFTDWILGIIVSIIALVAPMGCDLLAKGYVKLHKTFEKLFPNNSDEQD